MSVTDDPLWYKDAVIYELHVRSFFDSNGDGIGDFNGLVTRLDYLKDLGVTALWLLPFYPSPLRDDGYDIADYDQVNPAYGTLDDFRRFLDAAHDRGLRVITELVVNHTSTDHPWFQRARRSPPGSEERNFYVWSDSPERYPGTRIIFQDFETSNWAWDPVARQYYWHRFYSHQPDLNFDSPAVKRELFRVLDFWMEMGVDGMRLDAVPYLYEREGTNNENLPETHAYLRELRAHIDERFPNRMLLAEANQWPEDAAAYFGDGDECHMNFHFPLMPRMFMAVQQENNFPILDILDQTPPIPENCQWAVFLRNHDELTLEMVTDADRDYMYRVYAEDPQARINVGIRRRLAPLLKTRRKIELMNGLLLSLPGTPVLYYGDEIGMGDNIYLGDRNGVRTPMQWSGDRNAGFSRANPQKLFLPAIIDPEYHYEATNVEAHQDNPSSLLWWMKRILALRKQHKVFGRGDVTFLRPDNPKVLAFIREFEDDRVLIVANLSRFAQYVELDLREYEGIQPVEMFGQTSFPRIGELPYLLTLGSHAFLWFSIEAVDEARDAARTPELSGNWDTVFAGAHVERVERALPAFLRRARWFGGKGRAIRKARIEDVLEIPAGERAAKLLIVSVSFRDGSPEVYQVPLAIRGDVLGDEHQHLVLGQLGDDLVYDAFADPAFRAALLARVTSREPIAGRHGSLTAVSAQGRGVGSGDEEPAADSLALESRVVSFEQSNTSVIYGNRWILKLYRRLEDGVNPDFEIGRYLTEHRSFEHVPRVVDGLTYQLGKRRAASALLQVFVPNQGDAWTVTRDYLDRAFEDLLSRDRAAALSALPDSAMPLIERMQKDVPTELQEVIGAYIPLVERLAERTAQLHLALGGEREDPAFTPEALTTLHQRSMYQAARTTLTQSFDRLARQTATLPPSTRPIAERVLGVRDRLDARLREIVGEKIDATRIRCHGDYHLGQVLYTGGDFFIIDFEGEPARSLGERRIKQSPLRDVAGMLRSFHYAANAALHQGHVREEDVPTLEPWIRLWHEWVSAVFLRAYVQTAQGASFVPPEREQLGALLDFYLIEKCAYELGYELDNRPDWIAIPLHGLSELL